MKKPKNVIDIYSKRQKRRQIEHDESPDVWEYEIIPKTLRRQITSIWEKVFGGIWHLDEGLGIEKDQYNEEKAYRTIVETFRHERGEPSFDRTYARVIGIAGVLSCCLK